VARVLVGDFGVIAQLGLTELLAELGFEMVAEQGEGERFLERVEELRPDVVVLDLDTEEGSRLAVRIASVFAAIKVVACSTDEPRMRVFPRFHGGESYESHLNPDLLSDAIRS
jgi:DNA-binding NarL/FixJ family response regulator